MKYRLVLLVMGLFLSFQTHAGGISDGGGGTTNPSQVSPKEIAEIIDDYVPKIILAWGYRQEFNFKNLNSYNQGNSPYKKLFMGSVNFVDVIKTSGYEVRLKKACLDANGVPKEASIHSSKPGFICISPYLMANKLNKYNFEAETAALIIHELAHLVGATEAEAAVIQSTALESLYKLDFAEKLVHLVLLIRIDEYNPDYPDGDIEKLMIEPKVWAKGPLEKLGISYLDIQAWHRNWSNIYTHFVGEVLTPVMLSSYDELRAFKATEEKIDVIQYFVCMNDTRVEETMRQDCAREMEIRFENDSYLTARQLALRTKYRDFGSDYDLVKIKKPQNWRDVENLIKEISDYMDQVHAGSKYIFNFEPAIIMK